LGDDAAGDRFSKALAGLHDHLADIATMQKDQVGLELNAQVADGSVGVTVSALGQLVRTSIDRAVQHVPPILMTWSSG
jgi:hypothetical protein